MFFRQALLATLLVSGTAAVAAAQTGEFPFRRFSAREWRPNHFFFRDSDRLRANADRMRIRLQERGDEMGNRMRLRDFDSRDMAMRMRNRAFAMRDDARRNQMEFRYRDDGRLRDRMREEMRGSMDRFRFDRPFRLRRRSGSI